MQWQSICSIQIHPLMLANNLMVVNAAEYSIASDSTVKYIAYVASESEKNRLLNNPEPLCRLLDQFESTQPNESLFHV
jgi:hypothetical protein